MLDCTQYLLSSMSSTWASDLNHSLYARHKFKKILLFGRWGAGGNCVIWSYAQVMGNTIMQVFWYRICHLHSFLTFLKHQINATLDQQNYFYIVLQNYSRFYIAPQKLWTLVTRTEDSLKSQSLDSTNTKAPSIHLTSKTHTNFSHWEMWTYTLTQFWFPQ